METYNEYTKEEDPALWRLHQIHKQIAKEGIVPEELNKRAHKVMKKYGIKRASNKI